MKILVVDDSRLARDMVTHVLTNLVPDASIITATGGEEALDKMPAGETPDAAILDFNMPGMDGLTLAKHLRVRFPTVRIGILTANVQDALRQKAASLGCAFIPKPVTADKIRTFLAHGGE